MVMLIRLSGGIVHHVAYLLNQVIFQLTHLRNGSIAMGLQPIQMSFSEGILSIQLKAYRVLPQQNLELPH